jgi:phosphoglycerate dehydrogenase-like enzyme
VLKLLYYEILHFRPENLKLLGGHFKLVTLPDPAADNPRVLRDIDVCFAPLGYYFGAEKIDRCTSLRVIASNTTGTPHIDIEHAKRKVIFVASLAGHTEFLRTITPTAEHTWGLLLAVMRRVPWAFDSVLQGRWSRWPFGAPRMLSRMSLGIVGMGRLGSMVAKYGEAFGMTVHYYDPSSPLEMRPGMMRMASLEELVACSDVVSLHLPLNERTRNLFNEEVFTHFKDGAYLINTSRGGIVSTPALLASLESGKLAAAALDVLDDDFDQGFTDRLNQHPLVVYARSHDNLLITPHVGGSTVDAWKLTEEYTIRLVLDHLGLGVQRELTDVE